MGDEQVVHATGVGRARHAELAPGVGTQHIGHQLTVLDERLGIGRQAITVERRAAHGAHQVWPLINGQPLREQLLPQGAFEER
ncbi:hypothetical protein D3C78_1632260 [compost metagenome]